MSLVSNIKLSVDCEYRKALDMNTPVGDLLKVLVLDLAHGTIADKADMLWHDERDVSASSNDDIDLNGVLKDCFGDNFNAVKVKFLLLYNTSTTQTLTIGNASSNPWVGPFGAAAHVVTLKPATANNLAWQVLVADPNGLAVSAGSADVLRVANEAGSTATFGIIVVATSA